MLYCLDGLVSQRACLAPSYSSVNAVADKMYVVVRDESMEEATSAEGVGHVVARTANTDG